jgi:hypothetical protein
VLRAIDTPDRTGRAARVIARRRMEATLLDGLRSEKLATLAGLLAVDPTIRQTRFAWLRALPEAPSGVQGDRDRRRCGFGKKFRSANDSSPPMAIVA